MPPVLQLKPEGLYCEAGDFYVDPWRPVEQAIVTHGHSDHVFGNHQFRPCVIWGHERCVGFMDRQSREAIESLTTSQSSWRPAESVRIFFVAPGAWL